MEIDPLEALLQEALAHSATVRQKRTVKALPSKEAKPKLPPSWQDPSTWIPLRTVALIHEEGNVRTLLGNFQEFVHPRLSGARQLRRVSEPLNCDGMEVVKGDWWLTPQQTNAKRPERWVETKEALIGVTLKELGLHCPEVLVRVRLLHGGIERVELVEATRFGCPARHTFLILPQDLDILCAMDLDSKISLRHALQEEEADEDGEEEE